MILTIEDSFAGTAGAFVDCRKPTLIADNTAQPAHDWRTVSGVVSQLLAGGGCRFRFNPSQTPLIVSTAKQATVVSVIEAEIDVLNNDTYLSIGSCFDPLTREGFIFEIGYVGFSGVSARVLNGKYEFPQMPGGVAQIGAGGDGSQTALNSLAGTRVGARLTITVESGTRQRMTAEYRTNGGAWTTAISDVLSVGTEITTVNGYPCFCIGNNGAVNKGNYFKASYDPATVATPRGPVAKVLLKGDSNYAFISSAAPFTDVPHALGQSLLAEGYQAIDVFNTATSGITAIEWSQRVGLNTQIQAHAVALISYQGIKMVAIALGTNDAKDSNSGVATYKADMQRLITEDKAAGVTDVFLIGPGYVTPGTGDFSGANARIQNYGTLLTQLVAENTRTTAELGLYALLAANSGATYLPDGLHWSLGTAGNPAARGVLYPGLSASVKSAYPIVTVAPPVFAPVAGSVASETLIAVSTATQGAAIRYRTDDIGPTYSTGTLYTAPVPITSATTFRAIAYKLGDVDSNVVSSAYTIAPTVGVLSGTITTTPTTASGFAWSGATDGTGSKTAQFQRSLHGANSWSNVAGSATTNAATGQSASGLANLTEYDFSVLWTDGAGATVRSNILTATTTAVADGTPPTLTFGALEPDGVTIPVTLSEPGNQATNGISARVGGVTRSGSLTWQSTTAGTYTLATPAFIGQAVTGYYDPASGNILDLAGNELTAITARTITNGSAQSAPAPGTSPSGFLLIQGSLQVRGADSYDLGRLTYTAGDSQPNLMVQFTDDSGRPIDLTGSAVTVDLFRVGADSLVVNGAECVIESASLGFARYTFGPNDLAAAGNYRMRFYRTLGGRASTGTVAILVKDRLSN